MLKGLLNKQIKMRFRLTQYLYIDTTEELLETEKHIKYLSGYGNGTLSPDRQITRASVLKIVNNMFGRKADMDYINNHNNSITLFPDVPVSAWYYADVVESTNTHEYDKNSGTEIWK